MGLEPVYVQLSSADYHTHRGGGHFNRVEFHQHPERYDADFNKFTKVADLLIAGAYWNPKAPKLFSQEDILNADFRVKIVADITCDINGSVPCTKKPSSIPDPIYDYNPTTDSTEPPLTSQEFLTVMAVDNLPCELPRSASEEFGRDLIDKILKPLLIEDIGGIIERGTLAQDGALSNTFSYLQDYISQADVTL